MIVLALVGINLGLGFLLGMIVRVGRVAAWVQHQYGQVLADLRGERDTAVAERDAAVAARDVAAGSLAMMTGERDAWKAKHDSGAETAGRSAARWENQYMSLYREAARLMRHYGVDAVGNSLSPPPAPDNGGWATESFTEFWRRCGPTPPPAA